MHFYHGQIELCATNPRALAGQRANSVHILRSDDAAGREI